MAGPEGGERPGQDAAQLELEKKRAALQAECDRINELDRALFDARLDIDLLEIFGDVDAVPDALDGEAIVFAYVNGEAISYRNSRQPNGHARYRADCPACGGSFAFEAHVATWYRDGEPHDRPTAKGACLSGCDTDRIESALASAQAERARAQAEQARKELLARFAAPKPKPIEWLIPDLLPKGLALWTGLHGQGKTFVAMQAAACLATGRDFLGREVSACNVLAVWLDGNANADSDRLERMCQHFDTTQEDLRGQGRLHWYPDPLKLDDGDSVAQLQLAIEATGARLLILNNLQDVMSDGGRGNAENDAAIMGPIMGRLKAIARSGCAVLLVHHANGSGGPRGSSVIPNSVDSAFDVARSSGEDDAVITLRRYKGRYGGSSAPIKLRFVGSSKEPTTPIYAELVERAKPEIETNAVDPLRQAVIDAMPVKSAADLHTKVPGNRNKVIEMRNALEAEGVTERDGKGWRLAK